MTLLATVFSMPVQAMRLVSNAASAGMKIPQLSAKFRRFETKIGDLLESCRFDEKLVFFWGGALPDWPSRAPGDFPMGRSTSGP